MRLATNRFVYLLDLVSNDLKELIAKHCHFIHSTTCGRGVELSELARSAPRQSGYERKFSVERDHAAGAHRHDY